MGKALGVRQLEATRDSQAHLAPGDGPVLIATGFRGRGGLSGQGEPIGQNLRTLRQATAELGEIVRAA